MEYSRARVKLPPELDGMGTTQLRLAIEEANLGLADTYIAKRYLLDQVAQIEIAEEIGLGRSAVTKKMGKITPKIVNSAKHFNIPQ